MEIDRYVVLGNIIYTLKHNGGQVLREVLEVPKCFSKISWLLNIFVFYTRMAIEYDRYIVLGNIKTLEHTSNLRDLESPKTISFLNNFVLF